MSFRHHRSRLILSLQLLLGTSGLLNAQLLRYPSVRIGNQI